MNVTVNTIIASRYLAAGEPGEALVTGTTGKCAFGACKGAVGRFVPVELGSLMRPEYFGGGEGLGVGFVLRVHGRQWDAGEVVANLLDYIIEVQGDMKELS